MRPSDVEQASLSILLIEDDEAVRVLLARALMDAGYLVLEAADGQAGIDLYRKTQTDVVITDVVMPEKDGLEVIRQLHSEFPDVKIIAISGGGRYGGDSYLKVARALTAVRTLSKPFEIEALLQVVREVLEKET